MTLDARVVEAYRLDRYDNFATISQSNCQVTVVEAYRLDRYDNFCIHTTSRRKRLL